VVACTQMLSCSCQLCSAVFSKGACRDATPSGRLRLMLVSIVQQEARRLRDELRHLRVTRLVVTEKEPEKQDA
jgi:hypothetical protein